MRVAAGRRRIRDTRGAPPSTRTGRPRSRRPPSRSPPQGAALAEKAGFRAESKALWAAPTWKGIVDTADERNASLIVMGSHCRRSGILGRLVGSVAAAVVAHSTRSVLVVHDRDHEG